MMAEIFQRATKRSTKIFLRISRILLKNKAPWSQTQYNVRRDTSIKLLDTHIAHLERQIEDQNPGASGEVKARVFKCHERFQNIPEGKQKVASRTLNDITKRVAISRVPITLDRYLEDERYRDNLQSEGITQKSVNCPVLRAGQKEN